MSECCCCCCCFVDNYVMMMEGYWSSLNVPYTLKDLFQILFLSGPCHSPDTLWNLLLSLLLSYPFDFSTDGVYLHTSTEAKLFNLARLCAKTKVKTAFASEMLFADNAYRGNIAKAHQQIRQRMWKLWPRNQSQENQCECLGCQPSPWNQNRRPHSRGSRQIHLPRFNCLH